MSLQQDPEGYAQAKEELLEYWHESGTIIPLADIPFVWPESPPPQTEVPPDVREAIPPFNLSLDETFSLPDDQSTYLTDPVGNPDPEDILNTGKSEPLDMIFLLARPRNGVDHFRKFGPDLMTKAAVLIPKVDLKGEDGMDIPGDTGDVVKAIEKDAKMRVTQEDADYLRSTISRINVEKSVDIVLPRPKSVDLRLSPPLMPFSPLHLETKLSEEVPSLSLDCATTQFNETVLSSQNSQELWDLFLSPSPNAIETIINMADPDPSPAKVTQSETQLISKLKITPLTTPVSRRIVTQDKYQSPFQGFHDLNAPLVLDSPDSQSTDPCERLVRLEGLAWRETISTESSLRQPIPHIRLPTPRKENLPTSMFGLYIAQDGLSCPEIPLSELDLLNEQVKWQPFTKTLKNLNIGNEDVEGDWEMYVDWSGSNMEEDMIVLQRRVTALEEEALLEKWDAEKMKGKNDTPGLAELVRKRKMEKSGLPMPDEEFEETLAKRSKWSQRNRIEEYMKIQGLHLEINEDETAEKILTLGDEIPQTPIYTPIVPAATELAHTPIAPPPPSDPSKAVRVAILSTAIFRQYSLFQHLCSSFSETAFIERDLRDEGDIIVSPNRCILLFTLAQITQSLPSNTSTRILTVAPKYRQIEVIVTCTGSVRGKSVALFQGWWERVRREYNVRLVFANGDQEMKRWVSWLCLWREIDGIGFGPEDLSDEETQEESVLRQKFNAFAAQIILRRATLEEFMSMSYEERIKRFHDIASERALEHQPWQATDIPDPAVTVNGYDSSTGVMEDIKIRYG